LALQAKKTIPYACTLPRHFFKTVFIILFDKVARYRYSKVVKIRRLIHDIKGYFGRDNFPAGAAALSLTERLPDTTETDKLFRLTCRYFIFLKFSKFQKASATYREISDVDPLFLRNSGKDSLLFQKDATRGLTMEEMDGITDALQEMNFE